MKIRSAPSVPKGTVKIPPSKSHSIRAIFLAALASGKSTITGRLKAADVDSALNACRLLGASFAENGETLEVEGVNGRVAPIGDKIDVGNSGTTARFLLSLAALSEKRVTISGDESTRRRPMKPLLDSLSDLGAEIVDSNNGFLPVTIQGPIIGGETVVDGKTSQYLSSLLTHVPFCREKTTLRVESLNEKPYVDMTLDWLERVGLKFARNGYKEFVIEPGQKLKGFEVKVPADFSSAAFFLSLSAVEGADVVLEGLDLDDTQGDKAVIDYLKTMGADIEVGENVRVRGKRLKGALLDLNRTPDALPAMSVVASMAEGETRLVNVPQARIKETDRIAVMAQELSKMGVDITEEPDGLKIRGGGLMRGVELEGHGDHRIVMSLAVAGLVAEGETVISTAEAINITFPNFVELMHDKCGAKMSIEE
jgi:3-phosphoshikimate 1-carboxyvinyltransferase